MIHWARVNFFDRRDAGWTSAAANRFPLSTFVLSVLSARSSSRIIVYVSLPTHLTRESSAAEMPVPHSSSRLFKGVEALHTSQTSATFLNRLYVLVHIY